jgi:dTDP-4-dehydrorhamnose 3,5-epimerase
MTDRFEISETPLDGVKVLHRKVLGDERGFLERLFCARELRALMSDRTIKQINRTLTSRRGTVRGMHFQRPPHSETKFVTCLRGKVFDVAVDLRRGSPTFLKWHAEVLTASDPSTLFIPEGFAHGFQALSDDSELLYFHTAYYEPGAEGAINVRDPLLAIRWPEEITELSSRDARHPMLGSDFEGIAV